MTLHLSVPQLATRRWSIPLIVLLLFVAVLLPVRVAQAATIAVDTTTDEYNTGTSCSLREAITAANTDAAFGGCSAGSGADTITLPAGAYVLTLTGVGEDSNATGDLDVLSSIIIDGAGQATTIIDGNATDRIIDTQGNSTIRSIEITDLTLQNGDPTTGYLFSDGGAIDVQGNVSLQITNVRLSGNNANHGGAIKNEGAIVISGSTLSNNTAQAWGGAIFNDGVITITHSALLTNTANGFGGAIYTSVIAPRGGAVIETSTISGNSAAQDGGGIYAEYSHPGVETLTLNNSTIANNTANSDSDTLGDGGGVYVRSGATTVRNTIIANNTDTGGANNYPDVAGTFINGGNNLIGKNDGSNFASGPLIGTTAAPVDPQLGALADNGGATFTHALASTSPAVDAIAIGARSALAQPATCTANVSTDQRGTARANGTTTGTACDIGSFEYASAPTSVTVVDFSSQPSAGGGPHLAWATGDESTLAGFHVWRGTVTAAATRLTALLIGAAGGLEGHTYTWQDPAALAPGAQAHYWLEVVTIDGGSSFVGPVAAQGSGRLFLPMIGR